MLDTTTGEMVNLTLRHEGNEVREFYSQLPRPVLVGIEATGSMQWFLNLMDELGIECQVGHPATIRAAEPRTRRIALSDRRFLRERVSVCKKEKKRVQQVRIKLQTPLYNGRPR